MTLEELRDKLRSIQDAVTLPDLEVKFVSSVEAYTVEQTKIVDIVISPIKNEVKIILN